MRRDTWGLLVTAALVVLSLNLASAALTALSDGPALASTTDPGPQTGASAFLEATLVRTDLRPSSDTAEARDDAERCVAARTVRTTYRPVVLLNRSEPGCGAHERVDLTLYISAASQVELTDRWMAACHLEAYRLVQAPSGPMVGPKGPADCHMLELAPGSTGPADRLRVDTHISEINLGEPGLYLVCAKAAIRPDAGPARSIGDMTWFEAWDVGQASPHRDGHLQSQAPDTPCDRLDLEMPPGWPATSEAPG